MIIRDIAPRDRHAVDGYIRHLWGGPMVVTRGQLFDTRDLPGFVAEAEGALMGFGLYRLAEGQCEVAALLSLVQGFGVGGMLLDAVKAAAAEARCKRLWLITTNDNTRAIRFYQRYGFSLKAVHIGAFEAVRRLKGELPEKGEDGIPIEHEFEFEIIL